VKQSPVPGSDEERAQKILAAMEKANPQRAPRRYGSFVLLFSFLLVVAIVVVLLANWPKFSLIWTQLTRPDSLIGSP
jgi:cytochrome c-type biogenesis protein CcmH/NrfG